MRRTITGMGVAAFILSIAALAQNGLQGLASGLYSGAEIFISLFPLLIVAFIVAGLISDLIPEELVSRWMGQEAGWKGPFFGALAGALVPGGPFFFYPLMASLIISGAEIGTMMSFVAAKTLWSVGRIPLEIALVGTELTLIRLIITFVFPVIIGALVNNLFSGFTDKIRNDVKKLKGQNLDNDMNHNTKNAYNHRSSDKDA